MSQKGVGRFRSITVDENVFGLEERVSGLGKVEPSPVCERGRSVLGDGPSVIVDIHLLPSMRRLSSPLLHTVISLSW